MRQKDREAERKRRTDSQGQREKMFFDLRDQCAEHLEWERNQ